MSVEQAIPQEDGTVLRRIYPGDGEKPIETLFDTDEMLITTREREQSQEQKAERRQRLRHPLRLIRDRILGALDTSTEAHAEQLATESGSHTFLEETVEGWRRSGDNHA